LILQTMFYANEIRDFDQVPKADGVRVSAQEIELGAGLIEKLSSENFEPENYDDEYRNRVLAMIEAKTMGREITVAPRAPASGRIIDLMEALKESMKTVQRGKKQVGQKNRRKA
jgi:DNA end-binding protein Ku